VRIEVVYGEEPEDAYQELVEDLLAIVTSFADPRRREIIERKKKAKKPEVEGHEEVEKSG